MEYTFINNKLFNEKLTHTEFRILACLISRYNSNLGYSSITRKELAIECNMNDNTVGRVLNQLEKKKIIKREKLRVIGRGIRNIYYIKKDLI